MRIAFIRLWYILRGLLLVPIAPLAVWGARKLVVEADAIVWIPAALLVLVGAGAACCGLYLVWIGLTEPASALSRRFEDEPDSDIG